MEEDFRTELKRKLEEVKDKEDFEFTIEINKADEDEISRKWSSDE